nr:DUF3592 domain-containing protein [Pseudomarimonas arenosa]
MLVALGFQAWAQPSPEAQAGQAGGAEELSLRLRIEPEVATYGRVQEAVLEVENLSARERRVEVKAMLGEVPHFVAGSDDVRFEQPDQAEQERWLIWPEQTLRPFDRIKLSFGFLVSWDVRGDLYLSAEARDVEAGEDVPLAVAHIRQTPAYPQSSGEVELIGILINVLIGAAFVAVMVLPVLYQRMFKRSLKIGQSVLQKAALIGGLLVLLISVSMIWTELEPRGWKLASCEVLDMRYSVHAETRGRQTTSSQRSISRSYYPLLALRYQAGEKLLISTGFRPGNPAADPSVLAAFRRGDRVDCYYDPSDPAWVVVDRELSPIGLMVSLVLLALSAALVWFGFRRAVAPAAH